MIPGAFVLLTNLLPICIGANLLVDSLKLDSNDEFIVKSFAGGSVSRPLCESLEYDSFKYLAWLPFCHFYFVDLNTCTPAMYCAYYGFLCTEYELDWPKEAFW